jgi:hypothetical protein
MDGHTPSLWGSAMAKLKDADRKLLAFDTDDQILNKLDPLYDLEETTREAYVICIRKRWQITIPGQGKKVIVRDVLSKIAHWIEVFKSVGDQVVSYDPGHAALPWAGIRFLLQIAINDFNKFDFVVQGAERIARMAARYRILEQIYVEQPFDTARKLRGAIVRVYELIMKYLLQARLFFEQRTACKLPMTVYGFIHLT